MGTRTHLPALLGLLLVPAVAAGAEFLGPENCKVCHPAAYDAWKDSQHSQASLSLTPKQQKDARCLSCHSPEQARSMANVGCESCHGGGQYYSPRYVMMDSELARAVGMVDPSEKGCLKCHDQNAPSMVPFKFAEKLKLIDHWTAERAARKERAAAARTAQEEKSDKPDKSEKPDKTDKPAKPAKPVKPVKTDKGKSSQ